MGFKPLLSFVDAPDPDSVFYKPLHHKGRFIRFAAQAVKHEHQQDIELALLGPLFEKLQFIPVVGADLVAGHAVFLFLMHDGPAHLRCKLPAGFALDRDVSLILLIVVNLFGCGNAI